MVIVSNEKKSINVGTFFCGCFQDFLFVFHCFYLDTSGCRSLYIHPAWNLCFSSWIYRIMFFIRFGNISTITSLNIISASPHSGTPLLVLPVPYILVYFFGVPHFYEPLQFVFFSSLFFKLLNLFNSIFKFSDSSANSDLLLSSSSEAVI